MNSEYISACEMPHLEPEKDEGPNEQWNLNLGTATSMVCNTSIYLECNICLEFVQNPVVTLCGHLYCWPCIYKWIHFNSLSTEDSEQQPQCPVCKAEVSTAAVVPLYGRGKDIVSSEQELPDCGIAIPERPSAPICWETLAASTRHLHIQNPAGTNL